MAKAFVFSGQGALFVRIGKNNTDIMFNGTDEDLKQTKVTLAAGFLICPEHGGMVHF